jgi:hypothetical protein
MTYATGIRTISKGDRLYNIANTLVTLIACVAKAFTVTAGRRSHWDQSKPDWKPGDTMSLECAQFPLKVTMPLVGPIELATQGIQPNTIQFGIAPDSDWMAGHMMGNLQRVMLSAITPAFVELYEDYKPWIVKTITSDAYKYPAPWAFARVVRNAISHGGRLNIDNPAAQTVTWYGYKYGPSENGKLVIGAELAPADLMVLMFEMADTLDGLSCPI